MDYTIEVWEYTYMGDHAEYLTTTIRPNPNETVDDLVARVANGRKWGEQDQIRIRQIVDVGEVPF